MHEAGTRASSNGLSFPFYLPSQWPYAARTIEGRMRESNLQVNLPKQEHIHTKRYIHTVNPLKGICTRRKAWEFKTLQHYLSFFLPSRPFSSHSFHPTQLALMEVLLLFGSPLQFFKRPSKGEKSKCYFLEKVAIALCLHGKQKARKASSDVHLICTTFQTKVWRCNDRCLSVRCMVFSFSVLLSDPWRFVSSSQSPLNQCSMRYLCLQSLFAWQNYTRHFPRR